jgi:hypothetical protein
MSTHALCKSFATFSHKEGWTLRRDSVNIADSMYVLPNLRKWRWRKFHEAVDRTSVQRHNGLQCRACY